MRKCCWSLAKAPISLLLDIMMLLPATSTNLSCMLGFLLALFSVTCTTLSFLRSRSSFNNIQQTSSFRSYLCFKSCTSSLGASSASKKTLTGLCYVSIANNIHTSFSLIYFQVQSQTLPSPLHYYICLPSSASTSSHTHRSPYTLLQVTDNNSPPLGFTLARGDTYRDQPLLPVTRVSFLPPGMSVSVQFCTGDGPYIPNT